MTMPQVFRVRRGWMKSPPTHWTAAQFAGFKPPNDDASPDSVASETDLDALLAEAKTLRR